MFKAESQVVWDDDLTPDPPTSASQVLGSSVGTTMPGFEDFFFFLNQKAFHINLALV